MFYQWLVGFTNGDGSFSVIFQGGSLNLVFKIGQSNYNLRALKKLYSKSIGLRFNLYWKKNSNNAHFKIRHRKIITSVIIPIFDPFPLLTSKAFNYNIFR